MNQLRAKAKAEPNPTIQVEPDEIRRARGELVRVGGANALVGRTELARAADTSKAKITIMPLAADPSGNGEFHRVTMQDLSLLGSKPLDAICLDRYVVLEPGSEDVPQALPVDVRSHMAAKTVVAKEMLSRLEEDVAGYAKAVSEAYVPRLAQLSTARIDSLRRGMEDLATSLTPVQKSVELLVVDLEKLRQADRELADWALAEALRLANSLGLHHIQASTGLNAQETQEALYAFWARRYAGLRSVIDANLLSQCLLSTCAQDDLSAANPFAGPTCILAALNLTAIALLHVNRVAHASRALTAAKEVLVSLDVPVEISRWHAQITHGMGRSTYTYIYTTGGSQ